VGARKEVYPRVEKMMTWPQPTQIFEGAKAFKGRR